MKKTIIIKGMSCGHCKASVEEALNALDNVESAEVFLEEGKAIVKGNNIEDNILKTSIEDIGFDVIEIK